VPGSALPTDGDTTVRFISTRKVSQIWFYTGAVVVVPIVLAGGWSTSSFSSLVGYLAGIGYGFMLADIV